MAKGTVAFFSSGKQAVLCVNIPDWITLTLSWLCQSDTSLPFFTISELSAAQRTHPGSLKRSFLLERSSFMTGLKVEYSWSTAVIYLESTRGIYMDRYILTFSYCVHSAPRGLLAKLLKEVVRSLWNSNKMLEPKLQAAMTNHQSQRLVQMSTKGWIFTNRTTEPQCGQMCLRIHRQWEPNCTLEVMTSSIR